MNNLLKTLFLIINLFSSTTSAVNNSSLPLSTDLKTGQNVSEIVKREGAINVQGGSRIIGFSRGLDCQRPCTISFPVSINNNKKGFLVSFICVENSVFTVKGHSTLIGRLASVYNYKPELGLEYGHISIDPDFWSDDISHKIPYTHCAKSGRSIVDVDESLPIIPAPNSPLSVGDKVYAYGGGSGMVNGVVLATGVTITVDIPGSCGEEIEEFHDVVKVEMNKHYLPADLGAPVYIPLPVPNSKQRIASPVGQVVENSNWEKITSNTWYYIPLDRILKDGNLKIESGDLSYLLPKPEEPNDKDLNNFPLTDNLTMNSNVSDSNLVKRQEPRHFISTAGFQVLVSSSPAYLVSNYRTCTLGFAIRKNVRNPGQNIDHGFLTLGDCYYGRGNNYGIFNYYLSQHNPGELEAIRIGLATSSSATYVPSLSLNFIPVKISPDTASNIYWDARMSTQILTSEAEFAEIINRAFVPGAGTQVCWRGGYSGQICGEVAFPSAPLRRPNPWYGLMELFPDLIKVRVGENHLDLENNHIRADQGAPVYFVTDRNAEGRATKVRPVGILMDYTTEIENDGNRCVEVIYMYCVSIDRILVNYPELSLIGTPPHQ